jgi:hypothetical protein
MGDVTTDVIWLNSLMVAQHCHLPRPTPTPEGVACGSSALSDDSLLTLHSLLLA